MSLSTPVNISLVTVGMNHLPLLKQFLKSVFYDSPPSISFELIYVDNCSTDGSVDFIKLNYPDIKVIVNKKPFGFAYNNNLGVKSCNGEYIGIVNPDIVLLPGAIDKMYHFLLNNQNVGIVVPKLLNIDLTTQSSVRKFITLKILINRILHNGNDDVDSFVTRDYLMKDFDSNRAQPIDWALGAAMFFKREWYEVLGGFDEGYFLYVEDVDICLRSWKAGRAVIYFPDSVMIHAHQRSSSKGWNKKKKMHMKSMVRYFLKHNILFNPPVSDNRKTIDG
ncbi:glycosyltransferase family 2 protein [Arcticibacter tournemirensis]